MPSLHASHTVGYHGALFVQARHGKVGLGLRGVGMLWWDEALLKVEHMVSTGGWCVPCGAKNNNQASLHLQSVYLSKVAAALSPVCHSSSMCLLAAQHTTQAGVNEIATHALAAQLYPLNAPASVHSACPQSHSNDSCKVLEHRPLAQQVPVCADSCVHCATNQMPRRLAMQPPTTTTDSFTCRQRTLSCDFLTLSLPNSCRLHL